MRVFEKGKLYKKGKKGNFLDSRQRKEVSAKLIVLILKKKETNWAYFFLKALPERLRGPRPPTRCPPVSAFYSLIGSLYTERVFFLMKNVKISAFLVEITQPILSSGDCYTKLTKLIVYIGNFSYKIKNCNRYLLGFLTDTCCIFQVLNSQVVGDLTGQNVADFRRQLV